MTNLAPRPMRPQSGSGFVGKYLQGQEFGKKVHFKIPGKEKVMSTPIATASMFIMNTKELS